MIKKIWEALKYRKIQVDILTVFLFLLIGSFTVILFYIYHSNKAIMVEVTDHLMRQSSQRVMRHVDELFTGMRNLAEIEKGWITDEANVTPDNKQLIAYMFDGIKIIPSLTILHVATAQGSWLGMNTLLPGTSYRNDPNRLLPKEYKYAIQYIDRSKPTPTEVWIYMDVQGKELETEHVKNITFDPRKRPWFIGAENTKKPFWTPAYVFAITHETGISFGYPLYNKNNKLIAVPGGDIELRYVSLFLEHQDVAKGAKLAILTQKGEVLAATHMEALEQDAQRSPHLVSVDAYDPIVAAAYQNYLANQSGAFLFDREKNEYLASFTPYQAPSGEQWLISIIIPASDFLAGILRVEHHLYVIVFFIIAIASVWIIIFSRAISKPIVALAAEVRKVQHLELEGDMHVKTSIQEIHLMQLAVSAMKSALVSFCRYVPKVIVRQLLEQGHEITLGGTRKELALFCSDVRSFTTISENIPIEQLEQQLAIYFEKISSSILRCSGTLDKYIGDGVLAFWGAPTPVEDAAFLACQAALLCQRELTLINDAWEKEGKPAFFTRIGLHIGNVVVGNIGTQKRMNYTVLGDAVHVVASLETINKVYGTKIIISEEMKNRVGERFKTRFLDTVHVKGSHEPIKIFELLGEL